MPRPRPRPHRGSSLVEVVVSTLLVGIVLCGALTTLGATHRMRHAAADRRLGEELALATLATVMALPYEDPDEPTVGLGYESGEAADSPLTWDDLDDYANWTETTITDATGAADADFAGWSRSVAVRWADRISGNQWLLYDTGLKRVIVTVTAPDGTATEVRGYRARSGALEQRPLVDTVVVIGVAARLEVGDVAAERSTNLLNHAASPGSP